MKRHTGVFAVRPPLTSLRFILALAGAVAGVTPATADTVLAATASNFAEAGEEISASFQKATDHRVRISFGSTGKLYAQIKAGAPFDVLLAADQERPRLLIAEGRAVKGSRFTFAVGRLSIWSGDTNIIPKDNKQITARLRSLDVRSIAIANPALAPYGLAGREVLERLGVWDKVKARIVMGENVAQAFTLVATGNATLGLVSRALLEGRRGPSLGGSRWDVPTELHSPIRQDAVLLARARNNRAAMRFLAYLKGAEAQDIMKRLGYDLPGAPE